MFYFERSYKVLDRISKLSEKILFDSIKPFHENPPKEKELLAENDVREQPSNLFSIFTADIINANIVFIR